MALISETFTKLLPTTEDAVFEISGIPSSGLAVLIANLDANNPITYRFQDSNDGVTWEDREFTSGDTVATVFTVAAGDQHLVKLSQSMTRLRLMAYSGAGNVSQFTITRHRTSPAGTATYYTVA